MKKVLHLITGLELGGGAENMLLQILPKMQETLNNQVCVIKGRGEIGKKLEESGVPVFSLELKNVFDIGIIFRYRKVLKTINPDIQVNYLIHADIFGRIFGKIFGVKKIVSYIRNIHRNRMFLMFLDRATLPLSDFVLTNSETAKKYYIEKMKVEEDRVKCIPNGVDISHFENVKISREEKLKNLKITEKKIIIGCVARLEKQKDIPTLIKSFGIVHKKNPGAFLLIVGHGSQKKIAQGLILRLGLEESAMFLEKRKDIPELLKVMDIFVLPSLNEGMSNALLEAMASKKIIITSDIEENKELIQDNYGGFNFKKGDVDDLAKKIFFCLDNQNKLEKYKNNAFAAVREVYSLEAIARKYKDFLANDAGN